MFISAVSYSNYCSNISASHGIRKNPAFKNKITFDNLPHKFPHKLFSADITKLKEFISKINQIPENYLPALFREGRLKINELIDIIENNPEKVTRNDLNYFIRNNIPLTRFDNEKVTETRKRCLSAVPYTRDSREYKENIGKILVRQFSETEKIPSEGRMIIVTGLPASGKSLYINKYLRKDYYLADCDEIKKMFPSYNNEARELNTLHNLAREILQDTIIPYAVRLHKNIVIPTTGLSEYIVRLSAPAKKNNYDVEIRHLKTTKEESMKAVVKRFMNGEKFVDPIFSAIRAPYLDSQLKDFENSPLVDRIKIIDSKTVL